MKKILFLPWAVALVLGAPAANKAPAWAQGTYVYRVCTPDAVCTAPYLEGLKMAANLFDGDVRTITISNGLLGHDHPGGWNWDGLWPMWTRPTFRVGGGDDLEARWRNLRDFMAAAEREANAKISFHVNLTDVNTGLADYPESLAFFRRLVETKSLYRRDWDPATRTRKGTPYVMTEEQLLADRKSGNNPVNICSLVNYRNFWDSGMAKEMIDALYARLPYVPPMMYLDVLTLAGSNFSTGYPDGPLGGSRETQLEGVRAICGYLRGLGTEVGTEGDRRELGEYGTYGWLHCGPGHSSDDYAFIKGASKGPRVILQHVYGNTGSFCVSPVALTGDGLAADRAHWRALSEGRKSSRPVPGVETWHVADRGRADDVYNQMPGHGGGDPFRGSWVDLVNDFYLVSIQELYHIGRGNVFTKRHDSVGVHHLRALSVVDAAQATTNAFHVADGCGYDARRCAEIRRNDRLMLEKPLVWTHAEQEECMRDLVLEGFAIPAAGSMNVYVNGEIVWTTSDFRFDPTRTDGRLVSLCVAKGVKFRKGVNELRIDAGPVFAEWSDGTVATWKTPSLAGGFEVRRGDIVFARDYDRMWPDTWSGKKKIHFFSWDGCADAWTLPEDWADVSRASLYPLTPDGRGKPVVLTVRNRTVRPGLLPQVPYVLVPGK